MGIRSVPASRARRLLDSAMKVSCLLLLLTVNKALAINTWPCCKKFSISGFNSMSNMIMNGKYTFDPAKSLHPASANDYILYRGRNNWQILSDLGEGGNTQAETTSTIYESCPEDLGRSLEFQSLRDNSIYTLTFYDFKECPNDAPPTTTTAQTTTTAAPTTTTAAQTTTTVAPTITEALTPSIACQSCRKVVNAAASLNGYYMLQGSGDNRCAMDGCLYQKEYTTDLYCFEKGVNDVQDVCP